jgi:hypothetical protein
MPGTISPIIDMKDFRKKTELLAKSLFGKSEVQNRISLNAVKMIIGDVVTLYTEFRNVEGLGALFFNPVKPEDSRYLNIQEIRKDLALAEELMDEELTDFFKKLLNLIDSEQETESPVVVMVDSYGMSVHLIDLELAEQMIQQRMEDAISDS